VNPNPFVPSIPSVPLVPSIPLVPSSPSAPLKSPVEKPRPSSLVNVTTPVVAL
jgi:hypothetical protein